MDELTIQAELLVRQVQLLDALMVVTLVCREYLMTHDYKAFSQACKAIRSVDPALIGDTPPPFTHSELMNHLTKGMVREAEYINRMLNSVH
jgi:hypothetical protein